MKLIVWDFDGTLVDSRPLIEAGMRHGLQALGLLDRPGLMEEWLKYVGLPVEEGLDRTFGPLGLDKAEVLKAYRSFDWSSNEHLIQPFPGMTDLILELRGRGQKMAVATSKRTIPLKRQMALFGWDGCFDPLITPDQVSHGKPHPESLELCLSAHGLEPQEALMIGDTPFDLEMARSAGVPSVAVGHGFYAQEALLPFGPRAYAPDVPSLREILMAMSNVE
ncbi:MAG TPA: HAD family hydrolase [Holophaga sp.]|jgi:HAD superfamily hydrolase (TIGR01509 family)|nr:HAD family hydrolase [Holophaga sp.]